MKLTAQVKLQPSPEQGDALLDTLQAANQAANWISSEAWRTKTFAQYRLHKLVYRECRSRFGLSAQVVVRVIAKVADCYKQDQETRRVFRPDGSIAYDARILRWQLEDQLVSIWTVGGRLHIPFVSGERQRALLGLQRGESDLTWLRGAFYLAATCEIEGREATPVSGHLGVDLGVVNIASDSDGKIYSGSIIRSLR